MSKKAISPRLEELLRLRRQVQTLEGDIVADLKKNLVGVTARQALVICVLAAHPGVSQTELVGCTSIDRSTLADIVRRLVRHGFCQRKRTKEDERAYAVKLTAVGEAAHKKILAIG